MLLLSMESVLRKLDSGVNHWCGGLVQL